MPQLRREWEATLTSDWSSSYPVTGSGDSLTRLRVRAELDLVDQSWFAPRRCSRTAIPCSALGVRAGTTGDETVSRFANEMPPLDEMGLAMREPMNAGAGDGFWLVLDDSAGGWPIAGHLCIYFRRRTPKLKPVAHGFEYRRTRFRDRC